MKLEKISNPARVLIFDADYEEKTFYQIIEKILEEFPFTWNKKKVLVKPNILGPYPPEKGVTTHPILVKAVVENLIKRGAYVVVGDNPGIGGYGMAEKAASETGILDASLGCYKNIGHNVVRHKISSDHIDYISVAEDVLDADIIVNLPRLKTHSLTYFTGAVKNTFGYIVGGDKTLIHSKANNPKKFAEALVDIYQIRPPSLNIMDAVTAMEGNGPSNGSIRKIGKIIASDNAVTLDTVAVNLIGISTESVPHLHIAGKRGLGETDFSKIQLNEMIVPYKDFQFPSTFIPGISGIIFNLFLYRYIYKIPQINKKKCEACGICIEHCPVDGIKLTGEFPVINQDKCIRCYCCQEMCPEDAVLLFGRTINFLRNLKAKFKK